MKIEGDAVIEETTSVEDQTGGEATSTDTVVEDGDEDDQTATTENAEGEAAAGEVEEMVISMGDEVISQEDEEQKQAPAWVKDLRKANREKDKRIRELEAKLGGGQAAQEVKLPPKPKLEDFDYDPDKYEERLTEWFEQKRKFDAQQEAARRAQEEVETAWQTKVEQYNSAKTQLKVPDYDDAEAFVQEKFNVTQQGIIIQGLENPALVVYALGKNQKKALELSQIADPVRFAVAIGKLETQLKVTTRKAPPPPPKTVTGTAPVSGAVDSNLERLRADAERTGDYSKVIKYKAQQKRANN